jgi:hypothetical protein
LELYWEPCTGSRRDVSGLWRHRFFTVSSVLGSFEAERWQSEPRHAPRLQKGLPSGRVIGVDAHVFGG